ncbi:hypothetical protein ACFV9W_37605 [Streptomyces sp. NPDC059897]|uniref:hypothetical protein n=1 Tax=Streptomyces sp. NPDC059897 TaxID=3346994 RepID=UPI00365109CC
MTHHKHHHGDEGQSAETATESVLEEFEEGQTDPRHRAEKDRRRGESGDALTPNEEAQEQAHGDDQ